MIPIRSIAPDNRYRRSRGEAGPPRDGRRQEIVSAKQLTRRLRREVTANPRKAAILGLLALVALYFWAPLLWGWIAGGNSEAEPAQAAATPEGMPPVLSRLAPFSPPAAVNRPPAGQGKEPLTSYSWDRLARWIEDDPRMKPAREFASRRDPFHAVVQEVAEKPDSEQIKAAEAAAAVTPESLGLVLSSTLIGPHRRTALVNGRTYEQGRTIELAKDGRPFEFTLSEVHPRRIVLKREGRRYELTIPQPAASGRLELYGRTN